MPYFADITRCPDDGRTALHLLVDRSSQFMEDLLTDAPVLRSPRPAAAPLLLERFRKEVQRMHHEYVSRRFARLHQHIDAAQDDRLRAAGLLGPALGQRLQVLTDLETGAGDEASYWSRVRAILAEIDLVLDALTHAWTSQDSVAIVQVQLLRQYRQAVANIIQR